MSILGRIRAHGGEVIRNKWDLILRRGHMTDAAVDWVKANKPALMREVWPEYDDWEERAAIREYDGGQPCSEAEADAYTEVMARC